MDGISRLHSLALLGFVVAMFGCGGSQKPPPAEPEPEPVTPKRSTLQMHAELGVLDEDEVRRTFEKVWRGPMTDCQKQANRFVAGNTKIKMRVNHQGRVKWAFFKESELGDQKVQACMIEALQHAKWPIPQGGEDGLVEQELPFAELSERPAVAWPVERVAKVVDKHLDEVRQCLHGTEGTFVVTVIVDRSGKAMSAGVAQPNENSDQAASCLAEAFEKFKYPKPGSWPAKVSIELPW